MEVNMWEENGRNDTRLQRRNKELARAGQCSEKDGMA
jgi:hypothetical protein